MTVMLTMTMMMMMMMNVNIIVTAYSDKSLMLSAGFSCSCSRISRSMAELTDEVSDLRSGGIRLNLSPDCITLQDTQRNRCLLLSSL